MELPESSQPTDRGSMLHGFLVAAGWNALALMVSGLLSAMMIGFLFLAGFGLLQFAWLLPIRAGFVKAGKTESAKGVLVTAGITVLLSAACWANLDKLMKFR